MLKNFVIGMSLAASRRCRVLALFTAGPIAVFEGAVSISGGQILAGRRIQFTASHVAASAADREQRALYRSRKQPLRQWRQQLHPEPLPKWEYDCPSPILFRSALLLIAVG